MKAIIRTKAGKEFSTMKVQGIESPKTKAGELKVRMASSRINPVDMDLMKGFPSLKYKSPQVGGIDGAGEILEIGPDVKGFKAGDYVMFYRLFSDIGTWGEEITINASDCSLIPDHVSPFQAGSIALPLITAYEGLLSLNATNGETILIHGAAGGVGFQAVQLAKRMGLNIIANASADDEEILLKAGVVKIIDYKRDDFFKKLKSSPPDYVFDVIGKETLKKSILLRPKAVVSTTYPDINNMSKTGVNLPGILKLMMRLLNKKFGKLAKRNKVKLIGQVTGANGKHMNEAINIIAPNYIPREVRTLTLTHIEENGLSRADIGKVIQFHH